MSRLRTIAACFEASDRNLAPIPQIKTRIIEPLSPAFLRGATPAQINAVMTERYGPNWENME